MAVGADNVTHEAHAKRLAVFGPGAIGLAPVRGLTVRLVLWDPGLLRPRPDAVASRFRTAAARRETCRAAPRGGSHRGRGGAGGRSLFRALRRGQRPTWCASDVTIYNWSVLRHGYF